MLLAIEHLNVWFATAKGPLHAVDNVSFGLDAGETMCLVGESGSGKSVTCYAALGLLPRTTAAVTGSVRFHGEELIGASAQSMRAIRGGRIAMIFQDPMVALNPVQTVGWQMMETLRFHRHMRGRQAAAEAVRLLERVGIAAPEARMKAYPHQLSGGMCQRVMIAMALAGNPDVLIADEPTTALDVTMQAQILSLLHSLCRDDGLALLLVTHDLGVVAHVADTVAVMYAGNIVEKTDAARAFISPRHPYTNALLHSLPRTDVTVERLQTISGQVPSLHDGRDGCLFRSRCERAQADCGAGRGPYPPVASRHGGWCACRHPLPRRQETIGTHLLAYETISASRVMPDSYTAHLPLYNGRPKPTAVPITLGEN